MRSPRLAILTGGGDAPGMNAAIKAFVYRSLERQCSVIGIYDGWEGLLGDALPDTLALERDRVRLWDREAGSNLGCTRTNPLRVLRGEKRIDVSAEILRNLERLQIDGLAVVGGRDTLSAVDKLVALGAPVVGIPKSVDLEIGLTDYAIGFDSALRTCADVIAGSRTSAGSRKWVQVVEVVGRRAGHLALWGGLAGGAQMILIPEHPFKLERVYKQLLARLSPEQGELARGERTPRYATVVVSEGARPEGMQEVLVDAEPDEYGAARLGGVGALLAERLRADTDVDARAVALGHPLRGGVPTALDRVMAHRLASAAVDACLERAWGMMTSSTGTLPRGRITRVPIREALEAPCCVDVARDYDTQRYFVQRAVS